MEVGRDGGGSNEEVARELRKGSQSVRGRGRVSGSGGFYGVGGMSAISTDDFGARSF